MLERQLEQTSLLYDLKHAAKKVDSSPNMDYLHKVFWLVPIGRNTAFVGRYAVMSELESRLLPVPDSVPTAVFCGLGGVG